MSTEKKMNENVALGAGEMVAYSMGGFGRGIFNAVAMSLLNYFYTNSIGMSAGIVGMVFMLSRILDGVTDVTVGVLTDKIRTKYGKARNWVLWSALPFGIATMLLFTVPDVSVTGKVIYIVVTYNLVTSILGTLFYVPHMTLPALMTKNQTSRAQLTIINQIFSNVASLIPSMILLPAALSMGGTQTAWIKTVLPVIPIGVISMLICFAFTRERVHMAEAAPKAKKETQSYGVKKLLSLLLGNKYWLMVLGIFIFDALSNNFFFASSVYYCQYILHSTTAAGSLTMIYTVAVMIALFLAGPSVKKMSKRNIFMAGAVIKTLGLILVIVLPASVGSFLVGRGIAGFGTGLTYATMYAFVPDTMEYGEWKTGVRLEGTLQSACSIGAKFGVGVAPGIVGILMDVAKYDGLAAEQSAEALNVIRICATWMPAIFAAVLIVLSYFYDLDKKYSGIMADLETRKAVETQ